jgi:hypothetical protein
MIHAGAASRIAEMDAMKQNISEAETRIKQSQEALPLYESRGAHLPTKRWMLIARFTPISRAAADAEIRQKRHVRGDHQPRKRNGASAG